MEAVEATNRTFFYSNKHNLCHKEILNPRVRPTRQRGLRDTLCCGDAPDQVLQNAGSAGFND
jgi:hypothetical protein